MQSRKLGLNGPEVSAIGYGCVVLSADDLALIGNALDRIEIAGTRYSEFAQARTNR